MNKEGGKRDLSMVESMLLCKSRKRNGRYELWIRSERGESGDENGVLTG